MAAYQRKNIRMDRATRLRVRTGRGKDVPFIIDLGQRNAEIVRGPSSMLRYISWGDAVTPIGLGYDLVHSKNAVPLFARRSVITFEDYLPRVPPDRYIGRLEHWLQRRLLSRRIVALVAQSEFAVRQFKQQNRAFPALPQLEQKLVVIYPTIEPRTDRPKFPSDRLRVLFVGRDFLRKGLPALVRAHEKLRAMRIPIETTVISSLDWVASDYIGPPASTVFEEETARLGRSGIVHHRSMPNSDVLQLMKSADYLAFPTLHDTFGFVSIEALACATPVITTATCAQPEIVEDGANGYLLPFENDEVVGKWIWIYRNSEPEYTEAYMSTIDRLGVALAERLAMCWEERGEYEARSAAALERIRDRFNPESARIKLEELYEKCRI